MQDLNQILDWSFTDGELDGLKVLARLARPEFKNWIVELLDDANFHKEAREIEEI